jgi:hypothetical protein
VLNVELTELKNKVFGMLKREQEIESNEVEDDKINKKCYG